MRAYLMFSEKDVVSGSCAAAGTHVSSQVGDDLQADLELKRLLDHMAKGDEVIYEESRDALLTPLQIAEAIEYRRQALQDVLGNPDTVRALYAVTVEVDRIKKRYMASTYRDDAFKSAVDLLKTYTKLLRELRDAAANKLQFFKSEGFKKLLEMLERELTDVYFTEVSENLKEISNVDNMLVSAKLGSHLQSVEYTLRRKEKGFWMRWLSATSFTADEHSPEELADISERHERAISEASNVLKWSATYLEDFFRMLRTELAFYIGCLNLSDRLRELGMPMCFPELLPKESRTRSWTGLYDVSLALLKNSAVIGNDHEATEQILYIITGANQGGKSTFLRSIGQAQLMTQCGMFVGATSYSAPLRCGIYTHFKREEDVSMESGRLDEELERMSQIFDGLNCGAMVLMNESFSSTSEREGSEICRQLTKAMMENGVEVFSVTHLYMYAVSFLGDSDTRFLRAQRRDDAVRTFKILPGEPLETAFGEDLYHKIFVQCGRTMG
jgi:DNA mismatch repair ATPase MutS